MHQVLNSPLQGPHAKSYQGAVLADWRGRVALAILVNVDQSTWNRSMSYTGTWSAQPLRHTPHVTSSEAQYTEDVIPSFTSCMACGGMVAGLVISNRERNCENRFEGSLLETPMENDGLYSGVHDAAWCRLLHCLVPVQSASNFDSSQ